MDIVIREIEKKDYPNVLSLWNNELNCNYNVEDVVAYYERVKTDERYKISMVI